MHEATEEQEASKGSTLHKQCSKNTTLATTPALANVPFESVEKAFRVDTKSFALT
jgi:hypothetical protein